jgi:hypothetical protein
MRWLLWFDACAGAIAGALMLALAGVVGALLGLEPALLRATAAANLCYALYSFSLARQAAPRRALIWALIGANASWMFICAGLALLHVSSAPLGAAYLAGEGLFVGVLAGVEARALRAWRP